MIIKKVDDKHTFIIDHREGWGLLGVSVYHTHDFNCFEKNPLLFLQGSPTSLATATISVYEGVAHVHYNRINLQFWPKHGHNALSEWLTETLKDNLHLKYLGVESVNFPPPNCEALYELRELFRCIEGFVDEWGDELESGCLQSTRARLASLYKKMGGRELDDKGEGVVKLYT